MIKDSKKLTTLSLFVAVGLVLQYIESRIFISPIPGGKLGLCNAVSIINIFMLGGGNALFVAVIRSILGSLLFGSVTTVAYSLSGALFSTIVMWWLSRYYPQISIIGISIAGAAIHNISQVIIAAVFYGTIYVFSYLPLLLITALFSGFITGYATHIFAKRLLKKELSK